MADQSDLLALALSRSQRQQNQQRLEGKLRQLQQLQEETQQLQQRKQQLQHKLQRPSAGEPPMHPSFEALAAAAASQQLGVWVAAATETADGRRLTVRLQPAPAGDTYTLQVEEAADGALRVPSHQLPPGTRVAELLEQHTKVPDLVHAVAREVWAFAGRRRQVEQLRGELPKGCGVWHDPACCDVRLRMAMLNAEGARMTVEVQLQYAPHAERPTSATLGDTQSLDDSDAGELAEHVKSFLELPLAEAFAANFR